MKNKNKPLFTTSRDACVARHITITFGKYQNVMYLVFVAYYDSIIFSKICSEGVDFLRNIEIALFATFQARVTSSWARMSPNGAIWEFFRSEFSIPDGHFLTVHLQTLIFPKVFNEIC